MDESQVEVTSDQKKTLMSWVKALITVVGFAILGASLGLNLSFPLHALTMPNDTYGYGIFLFWITLPPVGALIGGIVGFNLWQQKIVNAGWLLAIAWALIGGCLGIVLIGPAHALTNLDIFHFWFTLPPMGALIGVIIGFNLPPQKIADAGWLLAIGWALIGVMVWYNLSIFIIIY